MAVFIRKHRQTDRHIYTHTYASGYVGLTRGAGPPRGGGGALSGYEQALVSLKIKKPVDAGVGRTFAVIIEGG